MAREPAPDGLRCGIVVAVNPAALAAAKTVVLGGNRVLT